MIAREAIDATRAPLRRAHLLTAAGALAAILRGTQPADQVLQDAFRARKAGATDRARIAGLVYGVLREYFVLRAMLGESAETLTLCAARALRAGHALPELRELDAAALARRLADFDPATLPPAARHNLSQDLWRRLAGQYGTDEAAALAQALNAPATVDLRVNTLKATREQARERLAGEGIAAEPTPLASTGLRLPKRVALQASPAFRDGWVEPQDEGSQALCGFVEARPGETVVDFCAGAGGKTLALGAAMENRGTLHALDVSRSRLSRLAPRLARSGLTIVETSVLRGDADPLLARLAARCDAVLVDAPCSATGTLRRNPELRLRAPDIAALAATQRAILASAARLVRPGGRLVYATCSVLREENEAVAAAFLETHPEFAQAAELRLLPHREHTDAFYAALFTGRGVRRWRG